MSQLPNTTNNNNNKSNGNNNNNKASIFNPVFISQEYGVMKAFTQIEFNDIKERGGKHHKWLIQRAKDEKKNREKRKLKKQKMKNFEVVYQKFKNDNKRLSEQVKNKDEKIKDLQYKLQKLKLRCSFLENVVEGFKTGSVFDQQTQPYQNQNNNYYSPKTNNYNYNNNKYNNSDSNDDLYDN